ncbi:MAG: GNAT family N-acetyltransferase [Clostridia bacterium]|nr:GNAT family N-acetyltransferase [Clostridia bacterium]
MTKEVWENLRTSPKEDGCLRWATFLDDNTTMTSKFVLTPFTITYEGQAVPMVGVGGVATLPPYRGQGGIRACFEKALPDMAQRGALFSMLYPFSNRFYRKFGYELGLQMHEWNVHLDSLTHLRPEAEVTLLEKANAGTLAPLIQGADRAFEARYNGMVRTGEKDRAWIHKANPFTDGAYTYVCHRGDTPLGYVRFRPGKEGDTRFLDVGQMVVTDRSSLQTLLHLFSVFAADYTFARFRLPVSLPVTALLAECSLGKVEVKVRETAMVRVIRARVVLQAMQPQKEVHFALRLHDDLIAENNAVFRITGDPAQGTHVDVLPCEADADADMDIRVFSQLAIRRFGAEDLPYLPVTLSTGADLSGLFYQSPGYITYPF